MDLGTRDLLPVYWSRLFPFQAIYEWLNYGQELFSKREFVFNFGKTGDRFLRNLSFKDYAELKAYVKVTIPNKIDIGAVYSEPPQIGKTSRNPIQKELNIDIDINNYDDVRICCSGANICPKCWKYVVVAIKILDTAIKEDFGFEHILWVYSGRRGVHAWICDKRARSLRLEARLMICNYLQLVKGGDHISKKVYLREKLHPSEKRAIDIIDKVFVELSVIEQNMLGTDRNLEKFLTLFNKELRSPIKEYLIKYPTSLLRWNAFVNIFNKNKKVKIIQEWINRPYLIEEIKIQYVYPRIDLQVTHSLSHLLKSPFSIHPKTGIIGVPIDYTKIDEFDPFSLPTVAQLMDQIDSYCQTAKEMKVDLEFYKYTHDLEKTVLEDSYTVFYRFIRRLIRDSN
ncbi:DNA primase small subunit-like isoform X2 [Phymastichus coffea]|uniref:DNA primase small subunit-like isoform X2 n=1 Tax=Phymastichus coffea TaxID=108790 RepID=UPI00273CC5B2|nr:DNA primase small subunit-like isoform X2 [Phymastichus coffea]